MIDTAPKETPQPTPHTRPFWDAAVEGRLDMPYCQVCNRYFWYPRLACPFCASRDVAWRTTAGTGSVWSYVTMHRSAPGFDAETPYMVGLIELTEGPRLLSNVAGGEQPLPLGAAVRVEFERRGEFAVPVFRATGSGVA